MNTFLLSSLFFSISHAYDPSTPHPHKPTLQRITSKPAAATLSSGDLEKLKKGDVVLQTIADGDSDGGRGVAIQYVNAPAETVWDTILAYDRYPDWVDNVVTCSVYKKDANQLYVEMISSIWGVKIGLYTINDIHKEQGYMTWALDPARTSDAADMVGYWRVEQISTSPPTTRLDYATDMRVQGVPSFIASYLTKGALVDGTAWVKKQSERR